MSSLKGHLLIPTVIGPLSGTLVLEGKLSTSNHSGSDEYLGPTNVIPSASRLYTLPTANHYLTKNITVQKIPSHEVSNLGGGTTFIIAEE